MDGACKDVCKCVRVSCVLARASVSFGRGKEEIAETHVHGSSKMSRNHMPIEVVKGNPLFPLCGCSFARNIVVLMNTASKTAERALPTSAA